ncbi:hypothetical protein DL89DRAFT_291112 [Linderina pennispora]|uniref:Uncharacterized protein n=1 Tax=Linderina pennispora TaxID=61395 RepID=A0A1Y1WF68_9FUNG|nr:uncharacterized protein DL89DRAFT_291112 [Linderina pennispora]ORX71804.1 hypothetical protein DL89DRAFT_291112 [Linderina pennispora]
MSKSSATLPPIAGPTPATLSTSLNTVVVTPSSGSASTFTETFYNYLPATASQHFIKTDSAAPTGSVESSGASATGSAAKTNTSKTGSAVSTKAVVALMLGVISAGLAL